jgi:hypothetical protein
VIIRINRGTFHNSINKKGSSHFEIIISFILFVGFTLFLVLSLTPTKQDLLEESILFGVKNAFFDNVTTNLTSVLVDTTGNNNCPGGWESSRICRPPELAGAGEAIWTEAGKDCRFYVIASSEFAGIGSDKLDEDNSDICNRNDAAKNYSLGYIEKQQAISNKTLQIMKVEYNTNYNASKVRFGVPEVVDFAVDFDSSTESIDMDKTVPDGAPVIAGVYRKKVLYGNGSIVNQDFIVKVW